MRIPAAIMAALLTLGFFNASAMALTIGDPAPALSVGSWIKGEPVKSLEKNKFYVVEFWATWCGPCITSIPHLTELAHQHKDVTFVGVSVWEKDDTEVVPFVKKMGDTMDYHVAADDKTKEPKGLMAMTWMDATKQDGIPTAFIIGKDGRILWIGHPTEIAEPLAQVVAGTYDVASAKAAFDTAQAKEAQVVKLRTELDDAETPDVQRKDYVAALKTIDDLAAKHPDGADLYLGRKIEVSMKANLWDEAYALMDQYTATNQASSLNDLAWVIATDVPADKRDLDRAVKYATRAVELTQGNDAAILDTLARVYFEKGDRAKAIEWQEKAVDKASQSSLKAALSKTLTGYKAK